MTVGFTLMCTPPPQAPSGGALYTEFFNVADLADVVLLPDSLARTATSLIDTLPLQKGGVGRGQKKVCAPTIGLKFPAPLINFTFCRRQILLM